MQLTYKNKRPLQEILGETPSAILETASKQRTDTRNMLIRGDNLSVMQALRLHHDMKGKIDLVYIDPPFATNVIYRHNHHRTSTVSSSDTDDIAYVDTKKGAEYIEFIRERLILIRELMAEHASIYLHIDYKIGHYVKIVMDEIFGPQNFRNDIARIKCNPKNFDRQGYGNIKDLILFYTKSRDFVWHEPRVGLTENDIERLFPKVDASGRRYTTTPLHAPGETKKGNTGQEWKGMRPPKGRHWRSDPSVLDDLDKKGLIEWSPSGNPRKIIYADDAKMKGKRLQDIWEFKDPQYPTYPTEKNLDLLKTIVRTSSEPGQMVMDCFCGSGTTLVAAQELGRHWLGIDESRIAVEISRKRLSSIEGTLFSPEPSFVYMEQTILHQKHAPLAKGG
jgi:adenine-specific DNA-methyltransferase